MKWNPFYKETAHDVVQKQVAQTKLLLVQYELEEVKIRKHKESLQEQLVVLERLNKNGFAPHAV